MNSNQTIPAGALNGTTIEVIKKDLFNKLFGEIEKAFGVGREEEEGERALHEMVQSIMGTNEPLTRNKAYRGSSVNSGSSKLDPELKRMINMLFD